MIEPGKLNGYLVAIKEELRKAEGKHPKFCDVLTTQEIEFAFKGELFYKKINSSAPYVGDKILLEEFYESIHSYLQGDKKHTLEELAQCGAVIIRMMEFVEGES